MFLDSFLKFLEKVWEGGGLFAYTQTYYRLD